MTRCTVRPLIVATLLAAFGPGSQAGGNDAMSVEQRTADFARFCAFVEEEYAYFDQKKTDWPKACTFFAPRAASAADRAAYIEVLEQALAELYDAHAHLGTNTARSWRLVPTNADIFATWKAGRAMLTDVRRGSGAERAGLRAGMEVVAIEGEPVQAVARAIEPKFLSAEDPAARAWALQVALAGRRDRDVVRLTIRSGETLREVEFAPGQPAPNSPLTARVVGGVGHLRIHNSLGEQELVDAFDKALAEMAGVKALVIDLRDTPSGGNSTVARGIMGRFVERTLPYQRHEYVAEFRSTGIRRVWVEYVAPRGRAFVQPVVVLVGPWTGSMGEGLAIGLNATRGAAVLGRPMAHLLGANGETVLPHSRIVVRVPTEKLFHIDGTPREEVVPCAIAREAADPPARDRALDAALALARAAASTSSKATPPPLAACHGLRPSRAARQR